MKIFGEVRVIDELPKKEGEYIVILRGGHATKLKFDTENKRFISYFIRDVPVFESRVVSWLKEL